LREKTKISKVRGQKLIVRVRKEINGNRAGKKKRRKRNLI
jgi:hypothetical protein